MLVTHTPEVDYDPRMRCLGGLAVLCLVSFACTSSTSTTQQDTTIAPAGSGSSASADPWSTAVPHDAGASTTPAQTTPAQTTPAQTTQPAATTMVTMYKRGKFVTMPAATATERDGCIGTAVELAACAQLKPAMRCDLAPWRRASDVYCRGVPMRPGDMKLRPAEACGCTCSPAYIREAGEWSRRARACSNVP